MMNGEKMNGDVAKPTKTVNIAEPEPGQLKRRPSFDKKKNRFGALKRVPSKCSMTLNEIVKPTDIDEVLFDFLSENGETMSVLKFWAIVTCTGVQMNDPRLHETRENLCQARADAGLAHDPDADFQIDKDTFKQSIHDNIFIVGKVFKNDMAITEFNEFCNKIEDIFEEVKEIDCGLPSKAIPQLARMNPEQFGLSLCTTDGQRQSFGDADAVFTMQSLCKTMNYSLAVTSSGPRLVHQYVGQEPSGRGTSALSLDNNKMPHNPLINAGGILTSTLLKPKLQWADRFDYVLNKYKSLAGGEYVGFNNSAFLSMKGAADRDFALAYYMRENKCFPDIQSKIEKDLEFYFQLSSCEVTCESLSVMASTFANGGICPITGERVLSEEAVRDTLSLMYACGMYDHSGQFAFNVGLPAKSSHSGAIIIVVPNLMGLCVWCPGIDDMGISNRGINFCEKLVDTFNFHNYDDLNHTCQKSDPRKRKKKPSAKNSNNVVNLLFGAAKGHMPTIRKYALTGMDMNRADYDGRTAMHLAAAEGHFDIVKTLVEQCHAKSDLKDRWGMTALDDAKKYEHQNIIEYLEKYQRES